MQVFVLEDGIGRVTIDHMKAGDHVRTVLNNRKRQLPEDDIVPPVSSLLTIYPLDCMLKDYCSLGESVCLQSPSHPGFHRQITGYEMSVGDHRVA